MQLAQGTLRYRFADIFSWTILAAFVSGGWSYVANSDGQTRTGDALAGSDFSVSAFLNCVPAAGFSPEWDAFRRRVSLNARKGWPLDPELALFAAHLLDRFDDVSTGRSWVHPAGVIWEAFRTAQGSHEVPLPPPDMQIFPAPAEKGGHFVVMNERANARGFSCLYGLVTALFVAYRHGVAHATEDAGRHLEMLRWLLGETQGGEQLFDFLESTGWPLRSIDVEENIEVAMSDPPPRFVLFSGLRLTSPALQRVRLEPLSVSGPGFSGDLQLVVFGVHGATSLEPATALQTLWRDEHKKTFNMRFYGHPCPTYELTGYLCEWKRAMLPSSGLQGEDAIGQVLSEMVDVTMEHTDQPWDVQAALAQLIAWHSSDRFASEASLWLCTGPAVLCALLHSVSPDKPMVMWHCRHLLDGLGAMEENTRTLVLAMLRTVLLGAKTVLVACESFAAEQAAYQLGTSAPPVQQRLALYAAPYQWRGLDTNGYSNLVVVLRSMLWRRLPGLYFRTILEAFAQEGQDHGDIKFKFAVDVQGGLIPYDEMRFYRCGVLVPNDLTMATFVEAYAMGLPLLIPSISWLYRLQKSVPYGFMVHGSVAHIPCSNCSAARNLPPYWQEKRRTPGQVMPWLRESDFFTWPHGMHFTSIPELLRLVRYGNLDEQSRAMLEWMRQSTAKGLPCWNRVVAVALGAAPIQLQVYSSSSPHNARAPQFASRADVLYAGLACEHPTFAVNGWPTFRASVEANAEQGFPTDGEAIAPHSLGRVGESAVSQWNERLISFLTEIDTGSYHGSLYKLQGHCHLGVICALLLQARRELAIHDRPAVVARLVGLASTMLQPLDQRAHMEIPVGVWPVDSLSALVSSLMAARTQA